MHIPSTQIKDTEFICHTCLIPMKSNAGLKSHLTCHGHQNKMEAITSDAKDEWGGLIYIRCGNHHVCVFMPCCFNAIKILLKFYCH